MWYYFYKLTKTDLAYFWKNFCVQSVNLLLFMLSSTRVLTTNSKLGNSMQQYSSLQHVQHITSSPLVPHYGLGSRSAKGIREQDSTKSSRKDVTLGNAPNVLIQEAQLLMGWPTHGAKSIFATVMVIKWTYMALSLDPSLTDETQIEIFTFVALK